MESGFVECGISAITSSSHSSGRTKVWMGVLFHEGFLPSPKVLNGMQKEAYRGTLRPSLGVGAPGKFRIEVKPEVLRLQGSFVLPIVRGRDRVRRGVNTTVLLEVFTATWRSSQHKRRVDPEA